MQTEFSPEECRVLGTLVEKAQTVPASYPMTLNAIVAGCNQRNNRDPVTAFDEDAVLEALDSLRRRGLVREVDLAGSRVAKFRHVAREFWSVSTEELALLVELLLRGPQSLASLRGNAARMIPSGIGSPDEVHRLLDGLSARTHPLVRRAAAPAGSRAPLYAQLILPDLHPLGPARAAPDSPIAADSRLADRITVLEAELKVCRLAISRLASRLGEADPFEP